MNRGELAHPLVGPRRENSAATLGKSERCDVTEPKAYRTYDHAHAIRLVRSKGLLLCETRSVPESDASQRIRRYDSMTSVFSSKIVRQSIQGHSRQYTYAPHDGAF